MTDAPSIGVAMLGYAFMGKAHSRAFRALQELDPPLRPELVSLSGRDRDAATAVARRFGWGSTVFGWGDTFTHELYHLLAAVAGIDTVAPHGATFEDGYRCAEVCDAILRSAAGGRKETIDYR